MPISNAPTGSGETDRRELPPNRSLLRSHRTLWPQFLRCHQIDVNQSAFSGQARNRQNPVDSTKQPAVIPVHLLLQDSPSLVRICLSANDLSDRHLCGESRSLTSGVVPWGRPKARLVFTPLSCRSAGILPTDMHRFPGPVLIRWREKWP